MSLAYLELLEAPCLRCGNKSFSKLIENDRYFMGLITTGCDFCGLIQMNPRPTPDSFISFYKNDYRKYYQGIKTPSDQYITDLKKSERLDYTINYLKNTVEFGKLNSILDFGCSEGALFEALRRHAFKGELIGIEPNADFAAYAEEKNKAKVYHSIEQARDVAADLVIVNHVFEHLLDPVEFLKKIKLNMNPDGSLYVDIPDADRYSSLSDFHIAHVAHYTIRTIAELIEHSGFDILWIEQHTPPNHPKSIRLLAKVSSDCGASRYLIATNKHTEMNAWLNIQSFPVTLPAFRHSMKVKRRAIKKWLRSLF